METTTTVVDAVKEATGGVVGIASQLIDFVVGNPILILFFASSIVGLGVYIFRKLK